MAHIFITGSTDGLGKMAAELLLAEGHTVVLHARNAKRGHEIREQLEKAETILTGDLSSIDQTKALAKEANKLGAFDAIIHNAGIGYREPRKQTTGDGLAYPFAINVLAPYILTALIKKPKRLIYLSSGMHFSANTSVEDLNWTTRRWQGAEAYAETKFQDLLLAFAVARLCPKVFSNAVEPGWVATKMGGRNAPDDLQKWHLTQAWLATSDDAAVKVSGKYFFHQKLKVANAEAYDVEKQTKFLAECERLSGEKLV